MNNDFFSMEKEPNFKIKDTHRYTPKGYEYVLIFKYNFPSSFMKYFNAEIINSIEVNLNDKKQIILFIKEGFSHDQIISNITFCCHELIENHFILNDGIQGPMLVEKVRELSEQIDFKNKIVRDNLEIDEDIRLANKQLLKALDIEDYGKAARFRDKLIKLNGEKTSK